MTSPILLRLVLSHARRQLHQAFARPPPSRSRDYIHEVYQDLMVLDPVPQLVQVQAPNEAVDSLLEEHAKQGNTRDFEAVMTGVLSGPPTEHQRDLHVKAHIVNASLSSSSSAIQHFPTSALALLHEYEASGHFAPIKTYTRVISALFNVQTRASSQPGLGRAAAQAQAWDLFAHMRYVAHPVPDAHLYALMIRACGSFSRPEPERALDLWTEMQENGIKPTKGAYEAIARVCGRAGPEWVGEGMRFVREMANQYSISGIGGRGLWCALLEGCKRAGDLQKARWILAEAVRGCEGEGSVVDAEMMTHIFHTYAAYQVPFRRETTRLVEPSGASGGHVSTKEDQADETVSHSDPHPAEQTRAGDISAENIEAVPSFSQLPPQTSSDVIAETRALFDRILQDGRLSIEGAHVPRAGLLTGKFARVGLTPVLVNAYLSVFYSHASIETSRQVFDSLFSKSHSPLTKVLHPDEYACVLSLERCAIARAEERHIAARWAKDVWQRWEAIEADGLRLGKEDVGPFARLIERAHTAMRRVLVLSGDLDAALLLLRRFVSRYPPSAVTQSSAPHKGSRMAECSSVGLSSKPQILSTRTVLSNSTPLTARPLVRLTSVVTPKDDRVPPLVGFSDVELLHKRLVDHGRIKDLGYIKWACMAYSHALRKRRDAVLRAAPTRDDEAD